MCVVTRVGSRYLRLAKVDVEGSNPFSRSIPIASSRRGGGWGFGIFRDSVFPVLPPAQSGWTSYRKERIPSRAPCVTPDTPGGGRTVGDRGFRRREDELDAGEAESLAYLDHPGDDHWICSADAIADGRRELRQDLPVDRWPEPIDRLLRRARLAPGGSRRRRSWGTSRIGPRLPRRPGTFRPPAERSLNSPSSTRRTGSSAPGAGREIGAPSSPRPEMGGEAPCSPRPTRVAGRSAAATLSRREGLAVPGERSDADDEARPGDVEPPSAGRCRVRARRRRCDSRAPDGDHRP